MYHRGFVLLGKRTPAEWLALVKDLVHAIGMTPAGDPHVWTYPNGAGAGGVGQTIIQPLTESFIALDSWDDHVGAYLFICSCKPFDRGPVFQLAKRRELGIDMEKSYEMSIPVKARP